MVAKASHQTTSDIKPKIFYLLNFKVSVIRSDILLVCTADAERFSRILWLNVSASFRKLGARTNVEIDIPAHLDALRLSICWIALILSNNLENCVALEIVITE